MSWHGIQRQCNICKALKLQGRGSSPARKMASPEVYDSQRRTQTQRTSLSKETATIAIMDGEPMGRKCPLAQGIC